jgi:2-dehydropantoate 2-reductase
MRVAVLGTGALGCVFAARLSAVAEAWVLGTWVDAIQAIRERGVRLHEPDGTVAEHRVAGAVTDPAAAPPCDAALLLVKSYQTERAAQWAARVLRADGLAVSLQNGLDNGPRLAAVVGAERAAVGVNYVGGTSLGPGEARFIVSLTSYIGETPATAAAASEVAAVLTLAGLQTRLVPDIESRLWGKAIINAAINPLTALWRVSNGDLLASAERRELLAKLAREAAAVAAASDIAAPFPDPVAATEAICRVSATNRSSMLQDIERGRPTEIDSINGVILAEANRLGITVPFNEVAWRLVRALSADPADSPQDVDEEGSWKS